MTNTTQIVDERDADHSSPNNLGVVESRIDGMWRIVLFCKRCAPKVYRERASQAYRGALLAGHVGLAVWWARTTGVGRQPFLPSLLRRLLDPYYCRSSAIPEVRVSATAVRCELLSCHSVSRISKTRNYHHIADTLRNAIQAFRIGSHSSVMTSRLSFIGISVLLASLEMEGAINETIAGIESADRSVVHITIVPNT
jgi:hypothetical protein